MAHVDASARPRVRWVDAEEDKVARLDLVQVVHGLGEVVLLVRVPRYEHGPGGRVGERRLNETRRVEESRPHGAAPLVPRAVLAGSRDVALDEGDDARDVQQPAVAAVSATGAQRVLLRLGCRQLKVPDVYPPDAPVLEELTLDARIRAHETRSSSS